MLRGVDVSVRLPVGSFTSRSLIHIPRCRTSTGLHILCFHDLHDARVAALHGHIVALATTIRVRLVVGASREVEQSGVRCQRTGTCNERPVEGRTCTILGILRIRSVRRDVLSRARHAAWIPHFQRAPSHCEYFVLSLIDTHSLRTSQLSSLFRVPLNVFVVISLLTGVSSARYAVLSASAIMLAVSAVTTALVIVNRADGITADENPRTA